MSELCDEIEKLGKGIGNVSRYKIVEALFNEPKTVSQLVKAVKISQSAMSQHLKTLKLYNIVIDERKGQEVYYRLNAEYTLKLLKSLSDGIKQQAQKGK
jgi:ArsR family transcriptional regulator, arsenate/arsenite/antimonite-responsive transcriptional repressor